jgi:hypothetical protein
MTKWRKDFLRANRTREFSHSLGGLRTFVGELSDCPANADTARKDLDSGTPARGCVRARLKCHRVCKVEMTVSVA